MEGWPGAVVFHEGVCGSLMHNWNPLLVKDGLCQRFGPDAGGIFPCHSSLSFLETWD